MQANQRDAHYDYRNHNHPLSPTHVTGKRHLNASPVMQHSKSSPILQTRNAPGACEWKPLLVRRFMSHVIGVGVRESA